MLNLPHLLKLKNLSFLILQSSYTRLDVSKSKKVHITSAANIINSLPNIFDNSINALILLKIVSLLEYQESSIL